MERDRSALWSKRSVYKYSQLFSCEVTLGKLFQLSEPQFLYLYNGNNNSFIERSFQREALINCQAFSHIQ